MVSLNQFRSKVPSAIALFTVFTVSPPPGSTSSAPSMMVPLSIKTWLKLLPVLLRTRVPLPVFEKPVPPFGELMTPLNFASTTAAPSATWKKLVPFRKAIGFWISTVASAVAWLRAKVLVSIKKSGVAHGQLRRWILATQVHGPIRCERCEAAVVYEVYLPITRAHWPGDVTCLQAEHTAAES